MDTNLRDNHEFKMDTKRIDSRNACRYIEAVKSPCLRALAGCSLFAAAAMADEGAPATTGAPAMTEVQLRQLIELNPSGFLPDLDEGRLYTGLKNLKVDPGFEPLVGNNNLRLMLKRVTGVELAEEEIQGVHFNVGVRGLSPINGTLTQVYQDGFPLNVDVFGNRAVASFPDVNQVGQAQFLWSGTGVLFGSQPGGAILLQSYPMVGDRPFRFRNTAAFGSFGYASELFEGGGTSEDWSYGAFGRFARGDGFSAQPDFDDTRAGFKLARRFSDHTALELGYQFYQFNADRLSGPVLGTVGVNNGLNYYYQNSIRHLLQAHLLHEWDERTAIHSRFWYHFTDGFRDYTQTAAPVLGRTSERFHFLGTDHRFSHEYEIGSQAGQVLSLGVTAQGSISPLKSIPTRPGEARLDLARHELNAAVFAENKFQATERLSITPGIRFEHAELSGHGIRGDGGVNNFAKVDRRFDDQEWVASLGAELDILTGSSIQERPLTWYGQVSRGYRPPTYNETVNQGFATVLAPGLHDAHFIQAESGFRGNPVRWFLYDVSAFWMRYDDQFATLAGTVRNEGRTEHAGVQAFGELELLHLFEGRREPDAMPGNSGPGRLFLFAGATYLDATIRSSPFAAADGATVPYAPEWTWKTGLSYNWRERARASLFLQSVGDQYGNLANDQLLLKNNQAARIPAFATLDFSAEMTLWSDRLTLFLNANNLTDESYFAFLQGGPGGGNRVIAPGRNFYGGFRLAF